MNCDDWFCVDWWFACSFFGWNKLCFLLKPWKDSTVQDLSASQLAPFSFLYLVRKIKLAATKTPMYSFYLGLNVRWPRGSENPQRRSSAQASRKVSENQGSWKRLGTRRVFLTTFLVSTVDMFAKALRKWLIALDRPGKWKLWPQK